MTPLSQRDSRWKDKKIGNSSSSIGGYGCTLTCLAMKAGTTPDIFDDAMTAVGGFQVDMILWPKINETNLGLRFPDMGRHYVYDNDLVLKEIADSGSCLVEVDFDGVISTPNDRHWVLFIGNQRCFDPWTGNEVATSKYPLRKGFCIINKVPISNPTPTMTDNETRILAFVREKSITETQVRTGYGYITDNIEKTVSDLRIEVAALSSTDDILTQHLALVQNDNSSCQTSLSTANTSLTNANNSNIILKNQVADLTKKLADALVSPTIASKSGWELISLGFSKLFVK